MASKGREFDFRPLRRQVGYQLWASCSHTCASVTEQYNLVLTKGRWCSLAWKVTADLAESNGSLPPGSRLSPVGWLPRDRDQLRSPTLVNSSMGLPLYYLYLYTWQYRCFSSSSVWQVRDIELDATSSDSGVGGRKRSIFLHCIQQQQPG